MSLELTTSIGKPPQKKLIMVSLEVQSTFPFKFLLVPHVQGSKSLLSFKLNIKYTFLYKCAHIEITELTKDQFLTLGQCKSFSDGLWLVLLTLGDSHLAVLTSWDHPEWGAPGCISTCPHPHFISVAALNPF